MKPTLNKRNALALFSVVLAFLSAAIPAFAGSATWNMAPATGDWNTSTNWTPNTVPNGAADTASFGMSNTTSVGISANTQVNGITFNALASAFTITANPTITLTISGVGITNNSGVTQTFVTTFTSSFASGSIINFTNSATAGSMTVFNNNGGFSGFSNGTIQFFNTSTAGSGTFNNNGSMNGGAGGILQFFNTSTAGNGTFTNNGGTGGNGGQTLFNDFSTAGSGTFTTNGSPASFNGGGPGFTQFNNNSSAGTGTFTTNAGGAAGANPGVTQFNGGTTAANGTFTTNGAAVSGAVGGITSFNDATAANGTFTNNGGTASGAAGGRMLFQNFSGATAASSTITNNGGTVSGATGSFTQFFDTTTAGSAILIANGGTGGGLGGFIEFQNGSTGGTAQAKVFGNGYLDINPHSAFGVTIGSLEGSGNVFLGSNNLTVGSNNLSKTFSGVIQDGGGGGAGGSGRNGVFTKIGTGTLTFEGGASNDHIADHVSLSIASNSLINLNFTGTSDTVRSLIIGGLGQVPGLYGSAASGAPHPLAQFAGTGKVLAKMLAVSRKTHGAAGNFDINLPFGGAPGIECRSGGANGNYQVVVTFLNAVTFDSATVSPGPGGAGMVSGTTGNGTTVVTVNLTGVTNAQTILVTLSNVNDGMTTENIPIPMGILIGDTGGNGTVNATDISQTKLQSGQAVTNANFREDINANGTINATDVSSVKLKSGTALP